MRTMSRSSLFAATVWLGTTLLAVALLASPAAAKGSGMKIQEVTSPGGIKAWLVESHANPLITLRFAFFGGASQDAPDKEGQAYFVTAMMNEGAGDLDATAFQEREEALAMKMNFDAGRDVMLGTVQTLTENKDEVFDLVRLALSQPRFDDDALERVRAQIMAGLKFDEHDPETVASIAWDRIAFQDHPYGRPVKGTKESVPQISADGLRDYVRRVFARDKLAVAVVGDIDAEALGKMLDKLFGDLPERSELVQVADAPPPLGPTREVIAMDVPQSVAQFGLRGIPRDDDDFISAYVLNYIIGGGGFSSRLMEEVREKRGLAYSVRSSLHPYMHGPVFVGHVATKNEAVGQSLSVIKNELERITEQGPTPEELKNAKAYLTGAYALRFESSSSIASQLLWIQIEDLGIDYIHQRNDLVEAVAMDDIKRVAKRLLAPDQMITTIVGKPVEPAEVVPAGAPG